VVVVGAGGFGRETIDVIEAVNAASAAPVFELLGVLDDGPSTDSLDRLSARGIRHLGPVAGAAVVGAAGYIVGIGAPAVRRRIAACLESFGLVPVTAVHPSAIVGSASRIGPGTVICAHTTVSTNVRIGAHVQLNPSVTVGHDSVLYDFVSVNPAATISGECSIRSGVLVGAGAVVLQGLTVHDDTVVGASACVVRDTEPAAVLKGVPAR
jgi:sugar O-acyltransferase (sialic acid O-acetyltransferase NeuD family)